MIKHVIGAGIVAAALLAGAPAFAQGSSVQRAACTPDVFRHCSGDIPNVDRITACLRREKAKLSAGCQSVFNQLEQTRVATRSIGAPDEAASAWCDTADRAAPGQEVWIAWCSRGARAE